jgi:heterodisulfide reductase subunit D
MAPPPAAAMVVPTVNQNPDFEILYWVGCSASHDPRVQKVARAVAQLLQKAQVNFACLGPEERCTGDFARRMGDEFLFQELAMTNIEPLNRHQVRRIVTHCPHCLNSIAQDYPQFEGNYEVIHHSQLLAELIDDGRLKPTPTIADKITYHAPCYLARAQGIVDEPRRLLQSVSGTNPGDDVVEMKRCGKGHGLLWGRRRAHVFRRCAGQTGRSRSDGGDSSPESANRRGVVPVLYDPGNGWTGGAGR